MLKFFILTLCAISLSASTLNLTISSNPSRINPILATDSASSEIAGFIFSALVKYNKDGTKIIGELASSFYFEDNRTIVFDLRKDVFWHDGEKFDANDLLFTYNLIISDKIVSPYSSAFKMVESVDLIDDFKVRVRYKKPYFKALETWMMGILPEHILRDEKDMMSSKFNTEPVGTGAYKLKSLQFSKSIVLEANSAYFEKKPSIKTISFHIIPDPMISFLMLKSGDIDIGNLSAMQLEREIDKEFFEKFEKVERVSQSYTYLGFNLRLDKFKDPRVREAISLAIDRDELVDILFLGHAEVCTGPFLPGSRSFNGDVGRVEQDLKTAKKLLREAGFDKRSPLKFEITTSNSNSIRPYAAQIIQHQLSRVGIEVTLRVMEWQAFLNMVVMPRKFDTILLGWSLSLSPDPYPLWHSNSDKIGDFNLVGYRDKEVDALIEKMQLTINKDELSKIQREIFAKIVEDNPYLFLYIPNSITAINRKIRPIDPTITGIWHNYIDWNILP